jgi:multicomponent Na+:H+ antiporter subunit E
MQTRTKSRIIVFCLSLLIWVALTSIRDWQEVLVGAIIAFLVAVVAGHFLITTEKQQHPFRRFIMFIRYIFTFLWEMIKANIHVAYIVMHPKLPIKPGIVKIKTKLTKDSAITVLTNSITLTPGTFTIDLNPEKKEIYIHWIDVGTTDIDEATEKIGTKFEKILMEVFE